MLAATLLTVFSLTAQRYKDASLPVEQRVHDLLSRMTVEEKVAQLRSTWSVHPRISDATLNNPHVMDSLFSHGIGMINPDFDNTPEQQVHYRNAIAQYLKTKTRLGIPAIFLDESHHGLLAQRVDVFPTSIGLACSWDTTLVQNIYTYIARQASARGTDMVLAPVIDVTRDPRWGRTGETFGEDPYLCGLMGSAVVRGFQGSSDGSIAPGHVAATLKHFTGHGQPEGGVNQGPADFPERVLRSIHMEPFRIAVDRVKPAGIMPAYVEIDGIPCHADNWLLTEVLRKEWGYKGILVSDWWAIDQLYQKYGIAADIKDAAKQAFDAGVTVDLPMGANYAQLTSLAKANQIRTTALDSAVAEVLSLKFHLGLFDHRDTLTIQKALQPTNQPGGRALALQAAEESMVLLKNDHQVLPLNVSNYKRIAVIGPCAATNYTGDYSGEPVHNPSLLTSIRARVGDSAEILYSKGVDLSSNGDTLSYTNFQLLDTLILPNPAANQKKIDEAVATAKQADIVICALGANEQFNREAEAPAHLGDISNLDLPSQQDELLKALIATGKPVIVYLAHGRPYSINLAAQQASAILDGWYTGEESANAAAKILFGDYDPGGKLTISIPRSVGQLPVYYNHKPGAQFLPYVTESNKPLYPFGYGLSYTTFKYSTPHLSAASINRNGAVAVSIDITNTGSRKGTEIVELYVHEKLASVSRPIKELKGFARATLNPGETKTVTIPLTADQLAIWNRTMHRVVEPGVYQIMVGPASNQLQTVLLDILQ